ncbi:MAG: zinc carboxypeptidase [Saprospirales bacterium]|nr:zinc carboxypeptidase [Saprospirales bacterium]
MRYFSLALLGLLLTISTLGAQGSLLSPGEFLPHPYAQQFTPHHVLVDYVEYVARESARVKLITYGYTNEDRPLVLAFISTPANLARMETIRQDHLKAAGFQQGEPTSDEPVAIVWLSFGVHGNEAGASESSMSVLHALADPSNTQTGQYLENTLVIFDPCINPDGYNRYTNWYRQVAPLEADPLSFTREHQEPWPGGRVNHYMFDLNRDWAWGTQVETRQRLIQYQRWLPHIHVDFPEQFPDNPYYFAPAAEPFHPAITQWQRDFQAEVGKNNARYFDREGWLYFTREQFDLFYPSYGDTYPTFTGAIGMTYEQAGHGISGRAIEMENGDTLTLADRVTHHTTTALATIETASKNASALNRQFNAFYDRARNQPAGTYKTFVIPHTNHPDQLAAFTRFLDMHQIRYGKAGKKHTSEGYDYQTGTTHPVTVAPEDLLVSAYQPAGTLAQVLLEPSAAISDSLTYDITAWSIIHSFGFEAYGLTARLDPAAPWQAAPYVEPEWPKAAPYAFLLPWTSLEDARFLGALLRENIQVRVATKPFRIEGRNFERGTLMITRADNRKWPGYEARVESLAIELQRDLVPVSSGLVELGFDFGSEAMQLLRAPRIALLSGEPVEPGSFGATWYFFEQVLHYPVSIIDAASFRPSRLENFDVLLLPNGNYSWDDSVKSKLAEWIRSGGQVIATGNALRWLQGMDGVNLVAKESPYGDEIPEGDQVPLRYEDRGRNWASSSIPGALVQAVIDNSHPIGFGFSDRYFSLKTTTQAYAYLDKGWNVAYLKEDPLTLGFVGSEAKKKIENTLVLGTERVGRGAVVYLVDDPLFRAFWKDGQLLFANALFFGRL